MEKTNIIPEAELENMLEDTYNLALKDNMVRCVVCDSDLMMYERYNEAETKVIHFDEKGRKYLEDASYRTNECRCVRCWTELYEQLQTYFGESEGVEEILDRLILHNMAILETRQSEE